MKIVFKAVSAVMDLTAVSSVDTQMLGVDNELSALL